VARDEARLRRQRNELAHTGATVDVRCCDLADERRRAHLLAELSDTDVSVLCNNAGSGAFGSFAELDADELHTHLVLDTVAVHDLCRAVVPGMVARGRGAILLTGSLAGNQPVPGAATYAASKAFVNSLAEALAAELAGTGVTVSLLTPGPVRTDFARRAGVEDAATRIPSAFWVDPDDVARAGLAALSNGTRRTIPGAGARALAAARRLSPLAAALPVLDRVVRKTVVG
jgi:short-subunit dehydrogenase